MFAGLFSAAPSIEIVSLLVTALSTSSSKAAASVAGMVVGAIAMVGYCMVAVPSVSRLGALWGSITAGATWLALAVGIYEVL